MKKRTFNSIVTGGLLGTCLSSFGLELTDWRYWVAFIVIIIIYQILESFCKDDTE